MDAVFNKFINRFKICGNSHYTHVSQLSKKSYSIERDDKDNMLDLYCQILHDNPQAILSLSEKPDEYGPILSDTDLKIPFNKDIHNLNEPLYTQNSIKEMVKIYQYVIQQIIKDYHPKLATCFVLEKSKPKYDKAKNEISHGFHLQFPFVYLSKEDSNVILHPKIKKMAEEKQIFNYLGISDYSKIVDKTFNKCWLMYGSRKNSTSEYYKLTAIYDDRMEKITLQEAMKDEHVYDAHEEEIKISDYEYYLPRILSIKSKSKRTYDVLSDIPIQIEFKKLNPRAKDNLSMVEKLKTARDMVKMLKPERADIHDEWMDIGWTLFNIGDGCQEALDIWIEFSKLSPKNSRSEKSCIHLWDTMDKKGKSLGTLFFYAKTDNPDEYNKYQRKVNKALYDNAINGGHYHLASILHKKYGETFICSCIDKDVWYRYDGNGWKMDIKGSFLRNKITNELTEDFKKYLKKVRDDGKENDEAEDLAFLKKKKAVYKIIGNLASSSFKDGIMKECRYMFYDENFMNKLDADQSLLRCKNGVIDLREMRFRDGKPTDYLSLSTNIVYKEFNYDDKEILECEEYMDKLFVDKNIRQYTYEYLASLLRGGNSSKTFLIMSGEKGDNGKTVFITLIKKILGSYFKTLPTSLLIGKRTQSSSATPELANSEGVRFAVLNEPSKTDVLNNGILKELTGNDELYTRPLFGMPRMIEPMWKVAMICNKLPKLPGDDQATWNRVRVLPFESCFPAKRDLVPETEEEQYAKKIFPRDDFFSEKLDGMASAFLWRIFEEYKDICKRGRMREPEKVIEATMQYRKRNDIIAQFISEKTIEDSKCSIAPKETYKAFVDWFLEKYRSMKNMMPSAPEIEEDLIGRLGDLINGRWYGRRIRTFQDDEKDGKVLVLREEDLEKKENDN